MYKGKVERKINTGLGQNMKVHFNKNNICNHSKYLQMKYNMGLISLYLVTIKERFLMALNVLQFHIFHGPVPKCGFNPDPIWDQQWNHMDPCARCIRFLKF